MTDKKERIADWILAGSAALAAVSAPFSASLAGGFVFHTALAAAVGGAADWFAVNSLFRKPLGIPFRTELVPRSHDKIIRTARDMVEKEILTTPRLYRVLKQHSPGAAFFAWAGKNKDGLRSLFVRAARLTLENAEIREAAERGTDALSETLGKMDWGGVLADFLKEIPAEEAARLLCPSLGFAVKEFLREGVTDAELLSLYENAWKKYEAGGAGRTMLRGILKSQLGLTDDKAAALIQEKLMDWADGLGNPESGASALLAAKYEAFRARLDEAEYREKRSGEIGRLVSAFAAAHGTEFLLELVRSRRKDAAEIFAEKALAFLETAAKDEKRRKDADRWLLFRASELLPTIHAWLGEAAEAALSRYSAAEMAKLVEDGVWHDLQMIRVNGSAIGAVLGAAAYVAFYLLEI